MDGPRRIIRPGEIPPEPGTPPNPFQVLVDPQTGNTAVVHPNGCQAIFGSNGIVGIRDAHGSLIQTQTDGSLVIKAKRLIMMLDEEPAIMIPETPHTNTSLQELS